MSIVGGRTVSSQLAAEEALVVAIFCDYQSRDLERRDTPLGLRREAHALESACGAVEAALVVMHTRLNDREGPRARARRGPRRYAPS